MKGGAEDRTGAKELFTRCADGDARAWEQFRARYAPLLEFLVRREMSRHGPVSEDGVEDCLGDLHLLLLKDGGAKLRGYETRFRPSTWLVLSVVTAVRDGMRRELRFHRGRQEGEGVLEGVPLGAPGPDALAARSDAMAFLRLLAGQLPARERMALRMAHEGGLTNRQIARALNLSEAATSRLLDRAREGMRRLADGENP